MRQLSYEKNQQREKNTIMKKEYKDKIIQNMEKAMNRPMKLEETVSVENDALALAQFLMQKVEELELRIRKLEP